MARVNAKKTELKCKLCSHAQRTWIDALLLKRSQRGKDDAGNSINGDYVLKALAEIGVPNPTEDNIKVHWRKHCEVLDEETAAAVEKAREDVASGELDVSDDPIENSRWILKTWRAETMARIRAGSESGITTDQAQKAATLLVQAKSDDSRLKLMGAVGAAIAGGFQQRALDGKKPELPETVDVLDAVEVDAG